MTAIDVRNLSIDLGYSSAKKRILGDVCFSVEAGESFGLVGESGSGKSTILRCIARLLNVWEGDIQLEGRSVNDMPFVEYCRAVQMVFQDPYGSLHPRQSIRTALQEPLRIHRMDRQVERMERALIDVGLDPAFLSRFPHELSGGQRQRVAIARALILEPRILLLDEPTSALDVSVQAEVLNLLADLRAKRNLTYLFVSHDLAVIDHMCERLAVMQHGRVVEVMSRDVLATGQAKDPYARELIQASLEYDHAV
ncbi:ABC-type dipeptide/oligopeptide/nickel transport system, ATPase component [Neorhizobium galegae bv. orientalis]|uniref:ABC transporter ATP-binding protein n=1 Tax=Neorhizobium galegae TaxID=399 RepID=UPI0006218B89|nr:ABC transporter ATP-binding protein [Neorhizobium galegae]CDZ65906.1 ABC-type dipeptide/oligopeptide/nickel transport system, ATPase component [Neorhizobium galegae bv. orientalis]MCQ1835252.1 ABC transporter ATP-binding protein [Neorhizobium galegae]MCQ1839371.1 ABC transporter ATP-binding protein [Neorhizobium galegae]UIY31590.1 ABC transporter ATP-binding protein [Neorhizobium galegae]CDZ69958.1 ABC-type dipeptide/oligopeptide/nickel transport system, ATPase component [Neorhizobium galeg